MYSKYTLKHASLALSLALLTSCQSGAIAPQGISPSDFERAAYHPGQHEEIISDEIVLYATDEATDADINVLAASIGGSIAGTIDDINLYQIKFENPANDYLLTDKRIEDAKRFPFVKNAFHNTLTYPFKIPMDWEQATVDDTWAQMKIGMPEAWERIYNPAFVGLLTGVGEGGMRDVAVVDLAFNTDNSDLSGIGIIEPYGNGTQSASTCMNTIIQDHGNHIAGIIGAHPNKGKSIAGINWSVRMHLYPLYKRANQWCPVSVPQEKGSTKTLNMEALLEASKKASETNPLVINYSLGKDWTNGATAAPSESLISSLHESHWVTAQKEQWRPVAKEIAKRNVLLVVAAGNNSDIKARRLIDTQYSGQLQSLADEFQNILVVSSIGHPQFSYTDLNRLKNQQAAFSAYPLHQTWVGQPAEHNEEKLSGYSSIGSLVSISAPGAGISSIGYDGTTIIQSGTSMAAPLVAGVASLVWSVNSKLTPAEVKQILIDSARSAPNAITVQDYLGNQYDYPVLNAPGAIERAYGRLPIASACTSNCNGHGVCRPPGQCQCNTGYGGTNCNACGVGYSNYPNCVNDCGAISKITWNTKARPPSVSDYFPISVVYQGKLHLFKGDLHYGYDPLSNTWSPFSIIPYPLYIGDGVALSVNGKIYAISDGSQVPLGTRHTMIWNEANDTWTKLDERMGAQRAPAYSYLNNEIIVAGSDSNTGIDGIVNAYNPVTNSWRSLASIPNPPGASPLAFGSYGGSLLIFGGLPDRNLLQVYDPLANKWTTRQPAPIARDVAKGFMLNQQLWIVGGRDPKTGVQDTIWIYDTISDKWCPGPTLPTKSAQSPIMEQISGKLYFLGSWPPDMWQGTLQ